MAPDAPVELSAEERAIDMAIVAVLDRYGEDKIEHWDVRFDASPDYVELRVILKDERVAYWKTAADGTQELLWEKTAADFAREAQAANPTVHLTLNESALAAQDGDFVNAAVADALERHSAEAEVIDIDGEDADSTGRTTGIEVTVQEPEASTATTYVYRLEP
jgi:hypothetical protein